jgi:hypothetical protein
MLCRKHLHEGSAELQIPRPSANVRDDKAPNDTGRGGRRFSAAPTARIIFDIDFPALSGWAHVWRPAPSTSSGQALWASHPWRLQCHLFLNLPQASRLLGMTRGRVRLTTAAVIGDGQSRRLFAIFISSGGNPFACFAIRKPDWRGFSKCDRGAPVPFLLNLLWHRLCWAKV